MSPRRGCGPKRSRLRARRSTRCREPPSRATATESRSRERSIRRVPVDAVVKRVELIWGTAIGVDVRDEVDASALDRVFEWFELVDERFSTWRADSEIVRLAAGDLALDDASADVREVLDLCERARVET